MATDNLVAKVWITYPMALAVPSSLTLGPILEGARRHGGRVLPHKQPTHCERGSGQIMELVAVEFAGDAVQERVTEFVGGLESAFADYTPPVPHNEIDALFAANPNGVLAEIHAGVERAGGKYDRLLQKAVLIRRAAKGA